MKTMEKRIFNEHNLTDDQIDKFVTRVKLFMLNSKNELLFASSFGGLQLIGGHVEGNEDLAQTVKREIQEESGIELDINEIGEPFFAIENYKKNHRNLGINCKSSIVYYFLKCDKKPNLNNINLTEDEKRGKFTLEYININDVLDRLTEVKWHNQDPANRVIAEETLEAFDHLIKHLKDNYGIVRDREDS